MNHQDTKTPSKDLDPVSEALAASIVDAAIKVHRVLGPRLLESAYEACLSHELKMRGHSVECQAVLPIRYEDVRVEAGYRIDMVVDKLAILELKAVEKLLPIHEAQLMTYLKLSNLRLGFVLNFNVPLLKDGIRRRVL